MSKCAGCGESRELTLVRERIPGSMGTMAQSFAGSYMLCSSCLGACEGACAIDNWQHASKKPRRRERVTVYARTLQWLKTVAKRPDNIQA